MNPSSATIQSVTNASGTVAIATSTTSAGISKVTENMPLEALANQQSINELVLSADSIAIFSASIMLLSFAWTVYTSSKTEKRDSRFYDLRIKEYELEKDKLELELKRAENEKGIQ